jgi:hypothetical protein
MSKKASSDRDRRKEPHALGEDFAEHFGFVHHDTSYRTEATGESPVARKSRTNDRLTKSDTTCRVSPQCLVDASSEIRKGLDIIVVEYSRDTLACESLVEFLLQLLVGVRSRNDLEQNGAVTIEYRSQTPLERL